MTAMKYCPITRGACREDCAMLMPYNDHTLCAVPMIAHELFIVAEELSRAGKPDVEMTSDGNESIENL